jgi:hypothetical protein
MLFQMSVSSVAAQTSISSGTITGTAVDPNNAVISGANVEVFNAVTNYRQVVQTNQDGSFRFNNVPFGSYRLTINADGFEPIVRQIEVQTIVPLNLGSQTLVVLGNQAIVEVTGDQNLLENVPTTQTNVNQTLLQRLPTSSPASGLSDAVILTAPGIATDANGFFHPLGDHAQTSIFLDNQPISDQQSTAFSTQLPLEAFQSLTIVTGTPNAEYGDKTSLVIDAVTRSGLGLKRPTGSFAVQAGSFSTVQPTATFGIGGERWGNFSAFTFNRSKRFLDSPEFESLHNDGTSINFFNRADYSPTEKDTFRLNFYISRNEFETPNTYDQQERGQDQRQKVKTMNIAPAYVRVLGRNAVLTVNPFYRRDDIKFTPSPNPLNDELSTLSQTRSLANYGFRSDLTVAISRHNAKFGVQATVTRISEIFGFGITDADFNDPSSETFRPNLLPYDLTRGGRLYTFAGKQTVTQQAVYAQDRFTYKNLTTNIGLRFDNYSGIVKGTGVQPRIGFSYLIDRTKTILRASFARTMETPYNENLILSSAPSELRGQGGILGATTDDPLKIGRRNQYNVGLQQQIGKYILFDADYFWKYTDNAYDFNVILNTPITFPIAWAQSKLDGLSLRVNLANFKNLSAFYVAGTSRARFFPPETGGLFFLDEIPSGVFRIDHEQKYQHSFQAQYQFAQLKGVAPYLLFGWKYDSGLVAGEPATYEDALALTPNQQTQIGLFCGNQTATRFNPILNCNSTTRGALRVRIPVGEANDDHNPIRIASRHIFNIGVGTDNLLGNDDYKFNLRFNVLNFTNKEALYNFLSPFGGTHFVAPRTIQLQAGIRF